MRTRRPSPEHQEAVSRRLALLSAELSAARHSAGHRADDPPDDLSGEPFGGPWWDEHTRIAVPRPAPPASPVGDGRVPWDAAPAVAAPDVVEVPAVPLPGRHAARRRRAAVGLVPDTLRGRVSLGSAQVAVVSVLVALGLAVTCWWLVRGQAAREPDRLAAAPVSGLLAPSASGSPAGTSEADGPAALVTPLPAGTSGAAAASAGTASTVTVDVAGKVRRPGIAVLEAGSRVADALQAAGGARPGVDLSTLNLARVLVDGEQVLVGAPAGAGPGGPAVPGPAAPGAPPAGVLVNLNTAGQAELETLPDVGPVTAGSILAWRDQHGGFTAVEELLEVDGIGDATLAKIAPHVTV